MHPEKEWRGNALVDEDEERTSSMPMTEHGFTHRSTAHRITPTPGE